MPHGATDRGSPRAMRPTERSDLPWAQYILHRLLLVIPTLLVISIISFVIIQLPPGDFLSSYIASLEASGQVVDQAQIEALRAQYGLGDPIFVQYWKWLTGVLQGNFGYSFQWQRPVSELLGERLLLTVALSCTSLLLIWGISFPIGIYSAVRQYSVGDYVFTMLSFIGLGVPEFPSRTCSHVVRLLAFWDGDRRPVLE